MERQDRERIDALESMVEGLVHANDALTDELKKASVRALALEAILKAKGVISSEETAAKMQAIDDAVSRRMEFAPENAKFRRWRRLAQEAGEQPDKKESSNTTPARPRDVTESTVDKGVQGAGGGPAGVGGEAQHEGANARRDQVCTRCAVSPEEPPCRSGAHPG